MRADLAKAQAKPQGKNHEFPSLQGKGADGGNSTAYSCAGSIERPDLLTAYQEGRFKACAPCCRAGFRKPLHRCKPFCGSYKTDGRGCIYLRGLLGKQLSGGIRSMLSAEQIKTRRGKLTGSRIACLMKGDAKAIHELWLEMTDDPSFVPEDLSRVWPVRLGECTEQLNCDWYQLKNNSALTRRGEVVVHHKFPWAAVTLDAWIEVLNCPLEAKHVGGREPLEVIIERYAAMGCLEVRHKVRSRLSGQ
jgi:hypothetical protein